MVHIVVSKDLHKELSLLKVNLECTNFNDVIDCILNDYYILQNISPLLKEIQEAL